MARFLPTYISLALFFLVSVNVFASPSNLSSSNITVDSDGFIFVNNQLRIKILTPTADVALDINGYSRLKYSCYQPILHSLSTDGVNIDWSKGNHQHIVVNTAISNTLNFINNTRPCSLILLITYTLDNPSFNLDPDIIWRGGGSPNLTKQTGTTDILGLFFDGTNYFGAINCDYK